MSDSRNTYLEQVVANQERLQQDMRATAAAPTFGAPAPAPGGPTLAGVAAPSGGDGGGSGSNAVDVRVTGRLRWRTVVVPPNAFVVHTRRGNETPLRSEERRV